MQRLAAENKPTAKPSNRAATSFDPKLAIRISADSVDELRKSDVYRVLTQGVSDDSQRQQVADYIVKHRPELKDEVDEAMSDIAGELAEAKPQQ